jgi:hypothetical protein
LERLPKGSAFRNNKQQSRLGEHFQVEPGNERNERTSGRAAWESISRWNLETREREKREKRENEKIMI